MKKILIYVCLGLLLAGCSATKNVMSVERKDSICTEVRYEKVFLKDTVFVEIPAQTAERTTPDSTSHLENDYAVSDAKINADGTLFHDLKTKPQKKPVPVDKEIERRDSVAYVDRYVEVPVPVERSLTYWEKTCINWFPYTLVVILLALVYIFRKPMRSLIRRFI